MCRPVVRRMKDPRLVMTTHSLRSLILACQIDQFEANLAGGKAEEMTGVLQFDRFQGPMQTQHRVLQHVIGLLPPRNAGKPPFKHPHHLLEASYRDVDQPVARTALAGSETIHMTLDFAGSTHAQRGLRSVRIGAGYCTRYACATSACGPRLPEPKNP